MKKLNIDIEEKWFIAKDPENVGKDEGWFCSIRSDATSAFVPSIIQQFFPEYHGVVFYWCRFTPNLYSYENGRTILRFGGVDYLAEVWLNSTYLGSYEGGETPFSFDVTDTIIFGEENLLSVRVVNPCDRDIDGLTIMNTPHRNKTVEKRAGSCLNHGGIWYGVSLSSVPAVYISDKFITTNIHNGNIDGEVSVFSALQNECPASLCVTVREKGGASDTALIGVFDILTNCGDDTHKFSLNLENFKLWSPDSPNLYSVEITLRSEYGTHTVTLNTGFREFIVKDGYFYLNGKRIFLKCSHSGNAFPEGQMLPVHLDHLRRDFINAKAAGFNSLRCIAGLFRPEQLDLADEIGLLIYSECFASWCMAYSQKYDWQTKEELSKIISERESIPVGDEATMLARWVGATEKMIMRDRNHPSVVIWGLLNETKNNSVFRTAVDFLKRARELDDTRVIMLNSGRFDFDINIGSLSNPKNDSWEFSFGPEGCPELWDPKRPHETNGDSHHYARAPISDADIEVYRTMGKNTPYPVFLSEFGIGANFHVIEEWKHFLQYGCRGDLEDASWLKRQSDDFTEDFYKFGLDRIFPFPESFLKESQRINADERKRIFDILRSNPRISGYSLTGLLDHGMCGEGLWSYWRRWKPEMFDTVSDGFEPLRFSLFATPAVYSDEEITIEATLANENVLKSGSYTADFAIIGDRGVEFRFSDEFTLDEADLATPIMKRSFKLDLPRGKYTLSASLREGSPAGTSTSFYVFEKRAPLVTKLPIYSTGFDEKKTKMLEAQVSGVKPWNKGVISDGIIIAAYASSEQIATLIKCAEAGCTVIFSESGIFFDEKNVKLLMSVDEGFKFENHEDWLYHKDYVLLSEEVFDGIDGKIVPLTLFGPAFAKQSFRTGRLPDRILCPGFLTGFYGVPGAYASVHSLISYKHGKGEIFLNSMKLTSAVDHPVANRIMRNLIELVINSKK